MKKTIIKTALITFGAIIIACGLIFGGMLLFDSHRSAQFFSNMGKEETALKYYERAYERDTSEENLLLVINSSISAGDNVTLIEYFEIYDKNKIRAESKDDEFIAGKYCMALLEAGRTEDAFAVAIKYVGGYSSTCAPRAIIAYGVSENNKSILEKALVMLKAIELDSGLSLSDSAKGLIVKDITMIEEFLKFK